MLGSVVVYGQRDLRVFIDKIFFFRKLFRFLAFSLGEELLRLHHFFISSLFPCFKRPISSPCRLAMKFNDKNFISSGRLIIRNLLLLGRINFYNWVVGGGRQCDRMCFFKTTNVTENYPIFIFITA
jgi:hypothetical protein